MNMCRLACRFAPTGPAHFTQGQVADLPDFGHETLSLLCSGLSPIPPWAGPLKDEHRPWQHAAPLDLVGAGRARPVPSGELVASCCSRLARRPSFSLLTLVTKGVSVSEAAA